MFEHDLIIRIRQFVLRIIRLCESLPKGRTSDMIAGQLLKCGTSVGANYRAACRARSKADFISKMGIVEEECDESIYWMDLLIETGIIKEHILKDLLDEANQILSIIIASIKTARSRK
ncbi:four helix bundle protein [Candidatus Sumerlaeota bacterium]|nr:four helix bundle protein [Candidatus Sumerlaeota bacterium]